MRFVLRPMCLLMLLLSGFATHAQEGFPLDGTWRGQWGTEADRHPIVIVMRWDGKNINGTISPGPNSVPFASATLEPSNWTVHIEARARDGAMIAIDATLEEIGSYHRTLTGTWNQAGVQHPFKIARE